jgi:MYXO-CTERM domain-containing protein
MRTLTRIGASSAIILALTTPAFGTIYSDSTGDLNDGSSGGTDLSGFTHLDITQVEVSNNASDLTFKIDFAGDILATDWGNYMIGIDRTAGGDTAGNGWGRPISMSSGMDYWIGAWVNSGNGAEVRSWDGAAWNLDLASYNAPPADMPTPSTTQFSVTVIAPLASLGLSLGDTFSFDVYSSGGSGGDSAIDALGSATPSVTDWPGPYDSGLNVNQYTVVPEPSTVALGALGLAALWLVRRRRS